MSSLEIKLYCSSADKNFNCDWSVCRRQQIPVNNNNKKNPTYPIGQHYGGSSDLKTMSSPEPTVVRLMANSNAKQLKKKPIPAHTHAQYSVSTAKQNRIFLLNWSTNVFKIGPVLFWGFFVHFFE